MVTVPRELLLLLGTIHLLLIPCKGSSSHSVKYFYTALSEPGQGLPQLSILGFVDDQLFVQYDSNTRKYLPQAAWMNKVEEEDPWYFDAQTDLSQRYEVVFRADLVILQNRYNQSGGFHTLQQMYGCELCEDGYKRGFRQLSYDGRDFLSFDKETRTWMANDVPAQESKRRLDKDSDANHYLKSYLEEECIEWLQKYLDYGKETLLRKEPPAVKVTRKAGSDGMETHICRAHGFYPKEIEIDWTKDGEVWTEDTLRESVSPNSDGTYHTWLSVEMDPKDRGRYQCRIRHDSLEEPGYFVWEDSAPLPVGVIVGAILAVAAAVLLVTGIVLYIRKRQQRDYKAALTSDKGSDNSATA